MSKFNGHPNWNQWNVSLWINNDEGLYDMARECVKRARTRHDAALQMIESLRECGFTETPDGAKYSLVAIRHAMQGME